MAFPSTIFQVASKRRPRSAQEASKSALRAPKSQERPRATKTCPGPPQGASRGVLFYAFLHFSMFFCLFPRLHVFSMFLLVFLRFLAFLVILLMLFCAFLRFCMFSVLLCVTTFFWIVLSRSLPCTGRILVFFVYVSL